MLAVLFIGGLIIASLWVLSPFLGALVWAVMIVIPTWPLLLRAQRFAGGRRWAAVALLSLPAVAQMTKPDAKGGVVTSSVPGKASALAAAELSAQVVAIDKQTRTLSLKGPKGKVVDVVEVLHLGADDDVLHVAPRPLQREHARETVDAEDFRRNDRRSRHRRLTGLARDDGAALHVGLLLRHGGKRRGECYCKNYLDATHDLLLSG